MAEQNSNSIRFIFDKNNLTIKFKVGTEFLYKDSDDPKKGSEDKNSIVIEDVEKFINEEDKDKQEYKDNLDDLKNRYITFKKIITDAGSKIPMGGGAPTAHSNYEQQIDELRQQIKELKNANDEAAAAQKMGGAGRAGGKKKNKTHTVRSKDYFLI